MRKDHPDAGTQGSGGVSPKLCVFGNALRLRCWCQIPISTGLASRMVRPGDKDHLMNIQIYAACPLMEG